MTPRERWLAAVQCQPVDRLPFWPKIGGAYASRQRAPYADMSADQLHQWIGSDRHEGAPSVVRVVRRTTSSDTTRADDLQTTLFHTPAGTLRRVDRFDPTSQSWHPHEFPVKDVADIEALRLFHEDEQIELDPDGVEKAVARVREIGDGAVTVTGIGISPLMDWIQHLAGIENGLFLLTDHPAEVEALFDVMHGGLRRRAEIIADKSPCDLVYSTENTSTTLISPTQFRRYCYGRLDEYGQIVRAAGKHHVLHMCGHLKAVLPDIATLPAAAIEAFTSPTVGNTTWLDGRTACPDTCLIGGTNATLWLEPPDTIIRTIDHDLSVLPHRRGIVVTSAGVMPPGCAPETIKAVCEWVKTYDVT